MIFLETSRLTLRTVTPEDAAAIHTWRSDPRCARYQRGQVTEYGEISALMAEHRADVLSVDAPFMAVMTLRSTGEPVGEIVVMPQDGAISLGFTVSPLRQRQGYAFEALTALMELLHARFPQWEFLCFTDPENTPSMALLTRLGCRDLGYVPAMDSRVFGKWVTGQTEAEIARAAGALPGSPEES